MFFILQILKCINHLSTDPNCLENLQRADAIKYLIPNLELKEGSLVSQIHTEVCLFLMRKESQRINCVTLENINVTSHRFSSCYSVYIILVWLYYCKYISHVVLYGLFTFTYVTLVHMHINFLSEWNTLILVLSITLLVSVGGRWVKMW